MKTLNLFNNTSTIEKEFNRTIIESDHTVYIRRIRDDHNFELETHIIIVGLNFLGKYSGNILFKFSSNKKFIKDYPNEKHLPELDNLSYDEIITFVKEIIFNYNQNKYTWNLKHRCNEYES